MRVVAADLDEAGAARVAKELSGEGHTVVPATVDVTSRPAVAALVAATAARWDAPEVVINLAGVIRNGLLAKLEDADFALTMSTHVNGALNTMREITPLMRQRRYGRIVNMSSIAVRGSVAGSSYGAAKGAIEGLTRSVAFELAGFGVTANCVAPGLIAAGMFLTVPEEYQEAAIGRTPMHRAGQAEEVAACVAFLASAEASYVTGQTLFVCGGLSIGY
jgi:3-oxoacyl-[acyl-carrier protein] reductase